MNIMASDWPVAANSRRGGYRLLFALQPDGPAAERIAALSSMLAGRLGPRAQPTPASRWHVSLAFVGHGDTPPPDAHVAQVQDLASGVASAPFDIAFDRVLSWKGQPGRRPFVLCGHSSRDPARLAGKLHLALVRNGLRSGPAPGLEAHLTLFWGDHDLAVERIAPLGWRASEFALLLSGAGRQQVLGRWPLRA
jgi:2'-5' RNA ligase